MVSDMRQLVKENCLQKLSSAYENVIVENNATGNNDIAPTFDSVKTILKRQRASKLPNLPTGATDIHLEGEWARTVSGECFVLPQVQDRTDVIFTCDSNLKCLADCDTWYIDGTFVTCPTPFMQMFSVHGLYHMTVIPLCYALLSDKLSATYYSVFNRVRDVLQV